jgi:mono/diheme cytochrome c family protein
MRRAIWVIVVLHASLTGAVAVRAAQQPAPPQAIGGLLADRTGQDIYRAACVTCHGLDGKGMPRSSVGFETPIPDFTDCAFAMAEADPDWHAVVTRGGPIRGLGRHMPAFGDALTTKDIELVVEYVRGFCADRAKWPQGDLNFPRAFFTEKAFPENEVVWTTAITGRGTKAVENALVYERRFGARNQIEFVAPLTFVSNGAGGWTKGIGDVAFAFKRAFYASMNTGAIVAAGGEVVFPTGNNASGLGHGYAVYEPFAMYNQTLPRNSYLQFHGGLEVPSDSAVASKESYLRTSIGTTLMQDQGFGRAWSPQVEVLWARPFGGSSEWDVVPQLQVSLSKIQHVMVAAGVRIPVNERASRSNQVLVYFLWDWFDGSLFDFWK